MLFEIRRSNIRITSYNVCYTKLLRVLWRPYHEMNGDWFWWGKKGGEEGYKKLWRMLYDRLVNFHGLNNLIWVFNTNEFKDNVDPHATNYPGDDVVDIVATDVYSEGFNQVNYDQMLELAGDKPIALGEVGQVPSLEIIQEQPRWTWFIVITSYSIHYTKLYDG